MALTKVTYSMIQGAAKSILDFGADPTGNTDSTVAIQTAINSGERYILVPSGLYNFTSLTLRDGVCLVGTSAFNSVLRCTSATNTAMFANVSNELHNLKFISSVPRTGGIYINVQGNGFLAQNCEFDGYYIAISVGAISDPITVNPRVFNCAFRTSVTTLGSGAVQFLNFSNAQVANCVITGTTVSSTQPTFGIRFQNGDTAFVTDCNVTVHGKALLVDPPVNLNCYALTVTSCVFDSAHEISGGTPVSSAEIGSAGGVWNSRFTNCWFGLSTGRNGCLIITTGSGVVDGIVFTGCEFTDNGETGLVAVGPNVKNWIVTGGHSGGNPGAGVRAAAGTTDFSIVGHTAGEIAERGPNGTGIALDIGAEDNFLIANNTVVGNTNFALANGATGTNGQIYNNRGYNGANPPIGLSVGASPWTYTAKSAPEQIFIVGGTVTDIEVSGSTIQNASPAVFTLAPNETMVITYSSAPNISRKVM